MMSFMKEDEIGHKRDVYNQEIRELII